MCIRGGHGKCWEEEKNEAKERREVSMVFSPFDSIVFGVFFSSSTPTVSFPSFHHHQLIIILPLYRSRFHSSCRPLPRQQPRAKPPLEQQHQRPPPPPPPSRGSPPRPRPRQQQQQQQRQSPRRNPQQPLPKAKENSQQQHRRRGKAAEDLRLLQSPPKKSTSSRDRSETPRTRPTRRASFMLRCSSRGPTRRWL